MRWLAGIYLDPKWMGQLKENKNKYLAPGRNRIEVLYQILKFMIITFKIFT
ncbi:unnamed protein product [Paramecium sonneborni]|uniref:Uncharacterized protein n=1 Tax=Paramecium sonneborni TaxID=65129 RepID=A0A8S1RNC9_9CILI|nr:unnamed protein product [Paramecium sonneborni]